MNAFALHHPGDRDGLRWTGSALAVLALHAALVAAGIGFYRQHAMPGVAAPPVMIDLSPISAAPQSQPLDLAPGPEMQQAEAPAAAPPEPQASQQIEDQIPPTPQLEKAEVAAPPEQKAAPTPPPPQPAQVTPEPPKPAPVKPKPVQAEVKKKPVDSKPAPRTSAPQRAEHVAPTNSAAMAGASRAAVANYNQMVVAHVQRFKQYPSDAKSGPTGYARAVVGFTLDQSGRLLSARLVSSSGRPAIDAEAVATLRRAQPFPAFPAGMALRTQSFSLPLSYTLR